MTDKHEIDDYPYPYTISNRIFELGRDLGYLAQVKAEGRELPEDAATAVNTLAELVETVKELYELNDDEEIKK